MGHHGAVTDADPADETPPPEPARALPDEAAGAAAGARAAAGRGPGPSGQPRGALYAVVALIVVLAFGSGVGVGRVTAPSGGAPQGSAAPGEGGSGAPAASGPGASPAPGAPSDPLAGLPSDGSLLGRAGAKVQVTYWADFQCPFCAKFAQQVLPQLASRIADGTASVRHRDFVFLGPESLDAAIAVRCAGEQGLFWPMHDAVYAAQDGENQGTFTEARLTALAVGAGADAAALGACTARHDTLIGVLGDTSAGVRAGVASTPTIDLPGRTFLGVTDPAALLAAIDEAARTGARPTAAPSVGPPGDPWSELPTAGRAAGRPSAPVTVELWVDYQAAAMAPLAGALGPSLRERIAAGIVRVVLRDLATLGDESVLAASFMRCAAQDGEPSVWFAHDVLASSAKGAGQGIFTDRSLLWFAAKLGWDVARLDACMSDPATASAVRAETSAGTGLGLGAAPAVIVRRGATETARFAGPALDAAKVLAAIDAAAK